MAESRHGRGRVRHGETSNWLCGQSIARPKPLLSVHCHGGPGGHAVPVARGGAEKTNRMSVAAAALRERLHGGDGRAGEDGNVRPCHRIRRRAGDQGRDRRTAGKIARRSSNRASAVFNTATKNSRSGHRHSLVPGRARLWRLPCADPALAGCGVMQPVQGEPRRGVGCRRTRITPKAHRGPGRRDGRPKLMQYPAPAVLRPWRCGGVRLMDRKLAVIPVGHPAQMERDEAGAYRRVTAMAGPAGRQSLST